MNPRAKKKVKEHKRKKQPDDTKWVPAVKTLIAEYQTKKITDEQLQQLRHKLGELQKEYKLHDFMIQPKTKQRRPAVIITPSKGGVKKVFSLELDPSISGRVSLPEKPQEGLVEEKVHDHHVLPQQFRSVFEEICPGINIDDYTVTLSSGKHLQDIHAEGRSGAVKDESGNFKDHYNAQWAKYFAAQKNNKRLTGKHIHSQLRRLMTLFNLHGYEVHVHGNVRERRQIKTIRKFARKSVGDSETDQDD
jgi:hypothetical protein